MKKMTALFVLACTFTIANANFTVANANMDAKTAAFVQPFDQSYALSNNYLWFTDIDLTDPTGTYCDIWYEMERLRNAFPGNSFSHIPYIGLNEFEFGFSAPLYFATIYSDLD